MRLLDAELTTDSTYAVVPAVAATATALAVGFALVSSPPAPSFACLSPVRQPETGQRHPGQADAKLFQRLPAGGRLGQRLGQFIEFVVHNFPFVLNFSCCCYLTWTWQHGPRWM